MVRAKDVLKLSDEAIEKQAEIIAKTDCGLAMLQTSIYAMIGGGMLASFAIRQPADFYIDDRVGGLAYPKKAIMQAVRILEHTAKQLGHNPHEVPDMTMHLNLGVF